MSNIVATFIPFSGVDAELVWTPLTGGDTVVIDNADQRMIFLMKNADTQNASVTLKAGDGSLGALGDAAFSVAGGKTFAVPLSRVGSARVKRLSGDGRGGMTVACTVDAGGAVGSVSMAVISVE